MTNLQRIQLTGILSEPTTICLNWVITNIPNAVNNLYTIYVNGAMNTNVFYGMSYILNNLSENTDYSIYVTGTDAFGVTSMPSNIITIHTRSYLNKLGSLSRERPFYNKISTSHNIQQTQLNVEVISPYPTFIDPSKKPFYQYYRIDPYGILFGNTPNGYLNFTKY